MAESPNNNIHLVTTPEDAVDQFLGEEFVLWLLNFIYQTISNEPVLLSLSRSKPKPEKIRKFLIQLFLLSVEFWGAKENDPGLLGFAISNLSEADDPAAEAALEVLKNKSEKQLSKPGWAVEQQHLWQRLLKTAGSSDEELARSEPKQMTRNYISEISEIYSNMEWMETMGAVIAHEKAIIEESPLIANMLKTNNFLDADLEIFSRLSEFNRKALAQSTTVLEKTAFDQQAKQQILNGVKRELEARFELYAGFNKYLFG